MNFSSILSVTLKFCFFITITAATLKLCFIFIAIPTANHKYISAYPADNGPAGQNSLSLVQGSTSKTLLHIFGDGDTKAVFAIVMLTFVNVFVYILWDYVKEGLGMKASARGHRVCRIFSLAEIQSATNNFDAGCVIGKGGFGKVYKGSIDKGRKKVAVKRLKFSSSQGEREFLTEIKTLSKLRNNNLVSLIGYCNEPGEMILVYKYMTLGSLSDHLFKHSSSLSWTRRLNICIGAGQGLDYVHRNHGIIHRDVKSSNILLDKNFVAKVSDFGLARPETRSESQCDISTNVKGTRGYLDPNYVTTGKPTRESDTYSFGVVLLEVLCGRPARDQRAEKGEEYLVTWAQANIRDGEVEKIISANLRGKISPESLKTFVKVARSCLHMDPNKRPTMGQVVEQLEVALEQQECQNSWGAPVRVPADEIVVGDEAVGLTTTTIDDNLTITEQNVTSSSRQQSNENVEPEPEPEPYTKDELELSIPIDCDRLGLASVKKYTNNFSNSNIICAVQHAILYESEEMPSLGYSTVVKRISNSVYGRKMFETELSLLSKYQHQNIMKLRGYAIDDGGDMMLVYYQLTKRTLRDVLLLGYRLGVSWMSRHKIIMGIANALAYLHQQHPELRKLYSHLKPSNILLDEDMNPEIAIDFGHKYGDGGTTTEEFTINNDYATPESEIKSDDSDVYLFGIIVLELVSGRRHCHSEVDHNMILQTWNPWNIDKAFDLIDESIRKKTLADPKEKVEVLRCIRIGISCTQRYTFDRPKNVSDVVEDLRSNTYATSPHIWRSRAVRQGY